MTYLANHYRPPSLGAAVGIFGHPNVVRTADYVLVLGGGQGTTDEVDLAISMGRSSFPTGQLPAPHASRSTACVLTHACARGSPRNCSAG
jgi:hypothetical protein